MGKSFTESPPVRLAEVCGILHSESTVYIGLSMEIVRKDRAIYCKVWSFGDGENFSLSVLSGCAKQVYPDTDYRTPVIFVLSVGR